MAVPGKAVITCAEQEEQRNPATFDPRPSCIAVNAIFIKSRCTSAMRVICERQNGGSCLETDTRGRLRSPHKDLWEVGDNQADRQQERFFYSFLSSFYFSAF